MLLRYERERASVGNSASLLINIRVAKPSVATPSVLHNISVAKPSIAKLKTTRLLCSLVRSTGTRGFLVLRCLGFGTVSAPLLEAVV